MKSLSVSEQSSLSPIQVGVGPGLETPRTATPSTAPLPRGRPPRQPTKPPTAGGERGALTGDARGHRALQTGVLGEAGL